MVRLVVEGTKWTIKGRVTTRGTMWKAWHPSISGLASRFSSRESDRGVTSSSAMVARARRVESDFWRRTICYIVVTKYLKRYFCQLSNLKAQMHRCNTWVLILNPVAFDQCELWMTCWMPKVFHVELLDAEGGEIRASFFNEAAEKLYSVMEASCFVKRCIGAHAFLFFFLGGKGRRCKIDVLCGRRILEDVSTGCISLGT